MIDPDLDGNGDEKTVLAEWVHADGVSRLTLHTSDVDGVAHLRRHRVAAWPPYDTVALIHYAGGVVSQIGWDERHSSAACASWCITAEARVRAEIAQWWAQR